MAGLYQDNCTEYKIKWGRVQCTLPPFNFEKEKKRGVFYCTLQLRISILIFCSSCDSFSLGDEYISEHKTKMYTRVFQDSRFSLKKKAEPTKHKPGGHIERIQKDF